MANSNQYQLASWLSMETLRHLVNKLEVASFFNTDDSKEFDKEFPIGATLRKKFPQRFLPRVGNTLAYSPQAINRLQTTITIDQIVGVDFEWDDAEAALQLERGKERVSKEYLEPAANTIKQEIDSRCANFARIHSPNFVGVLGTNPSDYKSISGAARQVMMELACPAGGQKGLIIPPKVNTALAASGIGLFNPASEISRMFKEGTIGVQGGFEWSESMSLYQHTAGTWQSAVTVTNTVTSDGLNTLTLTCTNGDVFNQGDKFSIAAVNATNPATRRSTGSPKLFTITSPSQTVSGTSVTITFAGIGIYGPGSQYQNVDSYPQSGAALTLFPGTSAPNGKTGTVGMAIHNSAFALAGVKLEMPKAVELASQTRDPNSGLSVRFVRAWDPQQSKMTNRFDVAFGFGELYVDNCIAALSA